MINARILVVDDENLITSSLKQSLEPEGYEVITSASGEDAIRKFKSESPDIVLLDINLPGIDGIKALGTIKKFDDDALVIMITACGGVGSAVKAMKMGAYDYIEKPFDLDRLKVILRKTLENITLKREVRQLRSEQIDKYSFNNIIGTSEAIRKVTALAKKIAGSDATTVLIQGQSGTGKDLMARVIHFHSSRTDKPFVEVSCTALPETLVESELFGYEKGAFTDAKATKKGIIELAEGGAIYLDEIGDMKPSTQAKLLRVIEEKTFKRVGGLRDIKVNIRVIAATNKNLDEAVKNGEFREDLYYRLKVIPIQMPSLSERREDIIPLISYFISHFSRELKKNMLKLTPEVKKMLENYSWPGNVRELRNTVERIFILSENDVVLPEHLPREVARYSGREADPRAELTLTEKGISLEELEKNLIRQALLIADSNQTKAAKLLGLSRDALRYRMQKFELL